MRLHEYGCLYIGAWQCARIQDENAFIPSTSVAVYTPIDTYRMREPHSNRTRSTVREHILKKCTYTRGSVYAVHIAVHKGVVVFSSVHVCISQDIHSVAQTHCAYVYTCKSLNISSLSPSFPSLLSLPPSSPSFPSSPSLPFARPRSLARAPSHTQARLQRQATANKAAGWGAGSSSCDSDVLHYFTTALRRCCSTDLTWNSM